MKKNNIKTLEIIGLLALLALVFIDILVQFRLLVMPDNLKFIPTLLLFIVILINGYFLLKKWRQKYG